MKNSTWANTYDLSITSQVSNNQGYGQKFQICYAASLLFILCLYLLVFFEGGKSELFPNKVLYLINMHNHESSQENIILKKVEK